VPSVYGIIVGVALVFLFGTVFGNVGDAALGWVMCKWCPEGWDNFSDSVKSVLSSGNDRIQEGVTGLITLRDDTEYMQELTALDSNLPTQQKAHFEGQLKSGLVIFGITGLLSFVGWKTLFAFGSFGAPPLVLLGLTFASVGIISYLASGSTPYQEIWTLMNNPDLWLTGTVDILSPIEQVGNISDSLSPSV